MPWNFVAHSLCVNNSLPEIASHFPEVKILPYCVVDIYQLVALGARQMHVLDIEQAGAWQMHFFEDEQVVVDEPGLYLYPVDAL